MIRGITLNITHYQSGKHDCLWNCGSSFSLRVKNNKKPSSKNSRQTEEQAKNLPHLQSDLNVKLSKHMGGIKVKCRFDFFFPPPCSWWHVFPVLSQVLHDFQSVTSSLHIRRKKMRLEGSMNHLRLSHHTCLCSMPLFPWDKSHYLICHFCTSSMNRFKILNQNTVHWKS